MITLGSSHFNVFQDHEFAPSDPTDVPIDNCGCKVTTAVTSEPTDVPETTTITSEPTAVTKSKSKKRKANEMPVTTQTKASKRTTGTSKNRKPVVSSSMGSDETSCSICGIRFCDPPLDNWNQCSQCANWYHESCGPDDIDLCYMCVD